MIPPRKPEPPREPPMAHEVAWRMAKQVTHEKGNGQAFNGKTAYEYIPSPVTPKKRRAWDDDEKPGFKVTYKGLSGPSPSVATNRRNLASQFSKAFMRSPGRSPR